MGAVCSSCEPCLGNNDSAVEIKGVDSKLDVDRYKSGLNVINVADPSRAY